MHAALERRHGGDELERRAGGIAALDRAVRERRVLVLAQARVVLREAVGDRRRAPSRARPPRRCLTSMTANAPLPVPPASAFWPASCTSRSIERRSWRPCWGGSSRSGRLMLPSASTSTLVAPLMPRRKRSYSASMPVWPMRSPISTPLLRSSSSCSWVISPTVPNRCAPISPCGYLRTNCRSTSTPWKRSRRSSTKAASGVGYVALDGRRGERQRLQVALGARARSRSGFMRRSFPSRS